MTDLLVPGISHDHAPVSLDPDNIWKYRVSSIYSCTSSLVAWRVGLTGGPAPEWMQERYDQGHIFEPIILERARQAGFNLYGGQMETTQKIGNVARLVGHIDSLGRPASETGIIVNSIDGVQGVTAWTPSLDTVVVLDAKAFAQSTWDKWRKGTWDAFPYYAWQMSAYSNYFGGIPIAMVIGLKDMDAARYGDYVLKDFRIDVFTKPPVPFGKILAKILKVEKLAAGGIDGIPGKCDVSQFPCAFFSFPFHTKPEKATIKDGEITGGLAELAALAEARTAAYDRMKAAELEVSALDDQMKSIAGGNEGNAKIDSDELSSVSFYYSTRAGIDWPRIAADFPTLDPEAYKTKIKSGKLSVKINRKRVAAPVNVGALVD